MTEDALMLKGLNLVLIKMEIEGPPGFKTIDWNQLSNEDENLLSEKLAYWFLTTNEELVDLDKDTYANLLKEKNNAISTNLVDASWDLFIKYREAKINGII
jgi:hypothetical protein